MPGDDLVVPSPESPAQRVDLLRTGVGLEVLGELGDELGGQVGVSDYVLGTLIFLATVLVMLLNVAWQRHQSAKV